VYVGGLRELETAAKDQVWAHDRPVTAREVADALTRQRRLAYTTVLTVMNRLVNKGMVAKQRPGRAATFRAVRSREAHTAALMAAVLGTASDGSAVLLRFAEERSADQADALRRALEASRGPQGSRALDDVLTADRTQIIAPGSGSAGIIAQDLAVLGGAGRRPGHGGLVAGPSKPWLTHRPRNVHLGNPSPKEEPTGPTGQPGSPVRRSVASRDRPHPEEAAKAATMAATTTPPASAITKVRPWAVWRGPARSGNSSCRPRV
jgi:predicted transcriptional regulator